LLGSALGVHLQALFRFDRFVRAGKGQGAQDDEGGQKEDEYQEYDEDVQYHGRFLDPDVGQVG
jgi:hypothetical protein